MEVYSNEVMRKQHITKWVRLFKEDRTDTHDEERTGRLSAISDELLQKVEDQVRSDCRMTLDNPHEVFPHISRTLLGKIVSVKVCARWVP